ncbi:EamA family transporter [Candidatus Woesearchaeota archaeon]|nr:EamA family transporter [Candidatus Woesearchaeota archaeon]
MATQLWAIGLVLFASFIGSFGPIFLKKGSAQFRLSLQGIIGNPNLLWGIAISALGNLLFIPSLKGGDLSVLYPLVSTIYIWVSIWSVLFLKEKMNLLKWAGVFTIIVGVAMVGIGG